MKWSRSHSRKPTLVWIGCRTIPQFVRKIVAGQQNKPIEFRAFPILEHRTMDRHSKACLLNQMHPIRLEFARRILFVQTLSRYVNPPLWRDMVERAAFPELGDQIPAQIHQTEMHNDVDVGQAGKGADDGKIKKIQVEWIENRKVESAPTNPIQDVLDRPLSRPKQRLRFAAARNQPCLASIQIRLINVTDDEFRKLALFALGLLKCAYRAAVKPSTFAALVHAPWPAKQVDVRPVRKTGSCCPGRIDIAADAVRFIGRPKTHGKPAQSIVRIKLVVNARCQ